MNHIKLNKEFMQLNTYNYPHNSSCNKIKKQANSNFELVFLNLEAHVYYFSRLKSFY